LAVNVVVCGRRGQPVAHTVQAIRQAGGHGCALRADVTREEDVQRVVQTAAGTYGTVDILINNAGIGGGGPIHSHDVVAWDAVMAADLRGPFLMARAVLPVMRQQRHGHIINISSEAGLVAYPGYGAYGVAKRGLIALGEMIERENQELGIRVDTICPGMVVTEMTEETPGLDANKCLVPQDIADLVVWLVTRRNNVKIGSPILMQTMQNPWRR
jgi:3-oxoacyl-[acyl-carrier protein] reductase